MILRFTKESPAILHLSLVDIQMSKLINRIGEYTLKLDKDYYLKLVNSIIGQQLSIKAKQTIWNRVESLCDNINPQNILEIDNTSLRKVGVSYAKISYIKNLSQKVLSKQINFESLESLDNNEVIRILTSVKGIGNWTAEMFLIFSLGRLNVMSINDAGLRRSIKWLYNFNTQPSVSQIKRISEVWNPYQSVASLYLWKAIDSKLIIEDSNIV